MISCKSEVVLSLFISSWSQSCINLWVSTLSFFVSSFVGLRFSPLAWSTGPMVGSFCWRSQISSGFRPTRKLSMALTASGSSGSLVFRPHIWFLGFEVRDRVILHCLNCRTFSSKSIKHLWSRRKSRPRMAPEGSDSTIKCVVNSCFLY